MINECQLVPHSVKMFKHGFRKNKIWTAKLDSLKKCEGPKLFDASFLNLNKLGVTIWYPRPYLPYEVLWAYFDDFILWPVCPLGPNNFENIEFLRSVLESLGPKKNICEIKNHNFLMYHSRKCTKSYLVPWFVMV